MLTAPKTFDLVPCDGLHTLPLYLGGERESLPIDCEPIQASNTADSQPQSPTVTLADYRQSLRNPAFVPQALRMALIVGSLVFAINHGKALMQNEMNRDRWLAGALSFVTPYLVSIYGQTQCQLNRSPDQET